MFTEQNYMLGNCQSVETCLLVIQKGCAERGQTVYVPALPYPRSSHVGEIKINDQGLNYKKSPAVWRKRVGLEKGNPLQAQRILSVSFFNSYRWFKSHLHWPATSSQDPQKYLLQLQVMSDCLPQRHFKC